MIKITVYSRQDQYTGFRSEGHAGYAEEGYDIICAAVSVLSVNLVNSIEEFTEDGMDVTVPVDGIDRTEIRWRTLPGRSASDAGLYIGNPVCTEDLR